MVTSLACADPLPCADPMLRIDAPEGVDTAQVCHLATGARDDVRVCGIAQSAPIDIVITETVDFAAGPALAAFDCRVNAIAILPPDLMASRIPADDPYAGLSPSDLFRSVLTHEMAHALLHQSLDGAPAFHVDHEYVANALELAALAPDARARVLEAADLSWDVTPEMISLTVYMIAPRRFAVTAWTYHDSHGCSPIAGILAGSHSFNRAR